MNRLNKFVIQFVNKFLVQFAIQSTYLAAHASLNRSFSLRRASAMMVCGIHRFVDEFVGDFKERERKKVVY